MFSIANAEQGVFLQPLIQQLTTSGIESGSLRGPLTKALGFNNDKVPAKFIQFSAEQTEDRQSHDCGLVVTSTASKNMESPSLVFITRERHGAKNKGYFFRIDLNGELKKAFVIYGEDDKSGKPIKGSGHLEALDITARDVRKRFQHELDFWLKGMYRKK